LGPTDMSDTARTDEIDEVLSSVRDFVVQKDTQKVAARDRLMLTQELRVAQEAEVRFEVEPANAAGEIVSNVHSFDPMPMVSDREGLEATIAELEAAVTAQCDNWEPDGGEDFTAAEEWAASAFDTPAIAGETREPQDKAATPKNPSIDSDAIEKEISARVVSGLDDAQIRALVVATVQDQLSGELGERITRNVRKLVRREINRVLASREMGQS